MLIINTKALQFACLLCAAVFSISCSAENRSVNEVEAAVSCLRDIPLEGESPEKWRKYFVCFPSSFDFFNSIFGSRGKSGSEVFGPLYQTSPEHILVRLPKTRTYVGDDAFIKKLVDLGVGATWGADAPNHLRRLITQEMDKSPEAYLSYLSKKNRAEITNFWRFIYDSPTGVAPKNEYCVDAQSLAACQVLMDMLSQS